MITSYIFAMSYSVSAVRPKELPLSWKFEIQPLRAENGSLLSKDWYGRRHGIARNSYILCSGTSRALHHMLS